MLGCTWLVDIFTTSVYVLIADKKAKFPKRIAGLPNALYTPPNSWWLSRVMARQSITGRSDGWNHMHFAWFVDEWVDGARAAVSHLGDKSTGRQTTGRHILVNWATEVETTGPQLEVWTINDGRAGAIMCSPIGQRDRFISLIKQTYRIVHLNAIYEVAGSIDASQCSVNQTAQLVSQPMSDFLQCRRPLITACYAFLEYGRGRSFLLNTQGQCRGTAFTSRTIATNTKALQLMDYTRQL